MTECRKRQVYSLLEVVSLCFTNPTTERSVRSIVRESAACLEIQKLQTLNSQLSSQLSELEHSNKKLQHSQGTNILIRQLLLAYL